MPRTKLANRTLPGYTRSEEIFNMISHIIGGGFGVAVLLTCVIVAAYNRNVWGIVSGVIYGFSVIILFAMSSVYHGLTLDIPKKVFQILDHCTIFILIAGTYTPVMLVKFREAYPLEAWLIFAIIWGLAILGVALNSIDLKKFKIFSMICYLGMGWLIVFSGKRLIEIFGGGLLIFLLIGGLFYTAGAVLYVVGGRNKIKFMHSVFHIFVDIAVLMHFIGIAVFVMPLR